MGVRAKSSEEWTPRAVSGRVAVVTGANTGIGLEVARALAVAGATVVLACRDVPKAAAAHRSVLASAPGADVHVRRVDLADLGSIAAFAATVRERWPELDLLVNNAGVMAAGFARTADGFELDLGTNALGPFALTGRLLGALEAGEGGRVVTVGSLTHLRPSAALDFGDLQSERRYRAGAAYGRSKTAAVTLLAELDRRLARAGARTLAVGAHPGGVRTGILHEQKGLMGIAFDPRLTPLTRWFIQTPADGARPLLRAALDTGARGGEFFGPRLHLAGAPVRASLPARARDPETGRRLWAAAQDLTGVRFLDG